MKKPYLLIALPLIAGCNLENILGIGGNSSPPLTQATGGAFNPRGPIINACESEYWQELVGTYDGQITHQTDELQCVWENVATVKVLHQPGIPDNSICQGSMTLESRLISGDSLCADLSTSGNIDSAFGIRIDGDYEALSNPPWPVESVGIINTVLDDGLVYGLGTTNNSHVWTAVFDGLGNIGLGDSLDIDSKWDGILVKNPNTNF